MKVAITGSSGLVGSALVRFFQEDGHQVLRLVRRPTQAQDEARWDPDWSELDGAALEGVDAVVNLCGANIAAARWTTARKQRLRTSRVGPTRLLSQTLAGLTRRPQVLVSSSAVGYYGNCADEWLDETTPPGDDFLAQLANDWERATEPAAEAGIRVATLRTGVVLSRQGGALARVLPPFRAGIAGVLGSGRQYMSWIAIDDLVRAIDHVIATTSLCGAMNAVAPAPVTNAQFTKTLGRVLGRPTITPMPAFMLRLAFSEMADVALLASQRVRPERLLASGFSFLFPELEGALRHLLGKKPAPAGSPVPVGP